MSQVESVQPSGSHSMGAAHIGLHLKSKRLATLQALFALRGYSLHQLADCTLLVERWGYCRPVATVDDATHVLAQLGSAPANWVAHG